jgi:hypothetical protein
MAIRFLGGGGSIEELRARIEGYGVPCRQLEAALGLLERSGYVECSNGLCRLTEFGEELADALRDVVESVRALAYRVLSGEFEEADIVAELVTPTASTIGFVEAYVEEPGSAMLYFVLHVYVSGLSASVLGELARVNAAVLDAVSSAFSFGG